MLSAGGHDVLAVTGSPAKRSYIEGLDRHGQSDSGGGSVTVVDASAQARFSSLVLKQHGGPVDMVVENVGAPTMEQSLRCLRSGGKLVLIGNVTNSTFPLPLGLCIVKSLSVIGTDSCEAVEVGNMMAWMQQVRFLFFFFVGPAHVPACKMPTIISKGKMCCVSGIIQCD